MGIAIPAAQVITSSVATRRYLESAGAARHAGLLHRHGGAARGAVRRWLLRLRRAAPQVVVVGLDSGATYAKFKIAALAIRAGARFVGTNPDLTLPTEEGIVPGAGSLQALLRAATDVTPLVIGKPEPTMLHAAIDILHADPQRTLVIGDRLDTDIAGARAAGLASALVLTGVTTLDELERSTLQPDAVYAGLPEMVAAWG